MNEVWILGRGPAALTFPTRQLAVEKLTEKRWRLLETLDELTQNHGMTYSQRQAMDVLCEGNPLRRIEIPPRWPV